MYNNTQKALMKMNLKKNVPWLIVALIFTGIIPGVLAAKPTQTMQGCQTEGGDYLVDILWVEFEIPFGIYDMDEGPLRGFMALIGIPDGPVMEQFVSLILDDGTIVGYFGPCCFKGGPSTYVDPRNNGFPNDCCKPPDFSTYPAPSLLGGGDGNMCLCQSDLHPTPEGRTYGGVKIDDIILLPGGEFYVLLASVADEEWIAVRVPFTP